MPMGDWEEKKTENPSRVSRRKFLERTAIGGLAAGLGHRISDLDSTVPDSVTTGSGIELKVVGTEAKGFGVVLLFRGKAVARHADGGEFSAVFQNGERSLEDRAENWKAKEWKGDAKQVTLLGECRLANLNVNVLVEVHYDVIGANVVRKRIGLRQADVFLLFHQVSNGLEPVQTPAKYWSFDQADCKGGALHENFPAAGFRLSDNTCVGLLTDSGFRNQWSRVIRRDGKPVKPAPRRIPDPFLFVVPTQKEREANRRFVEQTFGEMLEEVKSESPGRGGDRWQILVEKAGTSGAGVCRREGCPGHNNFAGWCSDSGYGGSRRRLFHPSEVPVRIAICDPVVGCKRKVGKAAEFDSL